MGAAAEELGGLRSARRVHTVFVAPGCCGTAYFAGKCWTLTDIRTIPLEQVDVTLVNAGSWR